MSRFLKKVQVDKPRSAGVETPGHLALHVVRHQHQLSQLVEGEEGKLGLDCVLTCPDPDPGSQDCEIYSLCILIRLCLDMS